MPDTAVKNESTVVVERADINRKLVFPVGLLHCELREELAYKYAVLAYGTTEILRATQNPDMVGFGNIIFGNTDPDLIFAAAPEALSAVSGGGTGGGGLSPTQTRDAVRDGVNVSTLVVGLRGTPTLATLSTTQINAGAPVLAAAATVRQRLLINNTDQPVYWNPGTVTPSAISYDHVIVPGGYLEPTYLGECRVFGSGLTAGEFRVRDYS